MRLPTGSAPRYYVVLVTAPELKTARKLARLALEARAAACVNIIPGLESHYWWAGKLDNSHEILLVLKTSRARLAALERIITSNHPYDTPEFIALPISAGAAKYLQWLETFTAVSPGFRPDRC